MGPEEACHIGVQVRPAFKSVSEAPPPRAVRELYSLRKTMCLQGNRDLTRVGGREPPPEAVHAPFPVHVGALWEHFGATSRQQQEPSEETQ